MEEGRIELYRSVIFVPMLKKRRVHGGHVCRSKENVMERKRRKKGGRRGERERKKRGDVSPFYPPSRTEKIDEERVRKQFSSPVVLSLRNGDLYSAS